MRPLNPDDYPIKLIEDLGMLKPTPESAKAYRFALFECPSCGKSFRATTNNVKRKNHTVCNPTCDLYKMGPELTQEELKTVLDYNPDTGIFTRKKCTARRHTLGEEVGVPVAKGYLKCRLGPKEYLMHRLVWFYVHGVWPDNIDHIDGNPKNNRLSNLRSVTCSENSRNMKRPKDNTSGIVGVAFHRNRWVAQLRRQGKTYTKKFKSKFSAIKQRLKWEKEFNFHKNHGRR
jgi:hypothetical protein